MSQLVEEDSGHSNVFFTPIRLNADNSRPRNILCFWLTFVFFIVVCLCLSIFVAPKEIVIKTNDTQLGPTTDKSCKNPCGFEQQTLICNPFGINNPKMGLLLRNVEPLHQFAFIYLDLESESSEKNHQFSQNLTIQLFSLTQITQNKLARFVKKQKIAERTIPFTNADAQKTNFSFYGQKIHHLLGFYRQLSEQNYLLVMQLQKPQQIINIDFKPVIKAIMINPQFSLFLIIIRGIGFVFTFVTGCIYIKRYLKIQKSSRLIEQKMVLVMSILILFFNNPFYALTIIFPTAFGSVAEALFLSQFIAYLFYFWIFGAHRILKQQGEIETKIFTKGKRLLCTTYFCSHFVIISWYFSGIAIASFKGHFIISPQQLIPGLSVLFLVWVILTFSIYCCIALQIYMKDRAQLWRSKSWLSFNLYFTLLVFVFMIFTGSFYQQNSKVLLFSYTSINLYCIYMQFMFTPILQQKPNLTMLPNSQHFSQIQSQENDSVDIQIQIPSHKFQQQSVESID